MEGGILDIHSTFLKRNRCTKVYYRLLQIRRNSIILGIRIGMTYLPDLRKGSYQLYPPDSY